MFLSYYNAHLIFFFSKPKKKNLYFMEEMFKIISSTTFLVKVSCESNLFPCLHHKRLNMKYKHNVDLSIEKRTVTDVKS